MLMEVLRRWTEHALSGSHRKTGDASTSPCSRRAFGKLPVYTYSSLSSFIWLLSVHHLRPGVQELRSYLAEGVSLDELWQVAKGQKKYADFKGQRGGQQQQSQEADIELDPELVSGHAHGAARAHTYILVALYAWVIAWQLLLPVQKFSASWLCSIA